MGRPTQLQFTPVSTIMFFYSVLLSALAFGLWFYILQYRKVGDLSIYKFIVPIAGAILSALFVPEEPILFVHIIGLILVSGGIIFVNMQNRIEQKAIDALPQSE